VKVSKARRISFPCVIVRASANSREYASRNALSSWVFFRHELAAAAARDDVHEGHAAARETA